MFLHKLFFRQGVYRWIKRFFLFSNLIIFISSLKRVYFYGFLGIQAFKIASQRPWAYQRPTKIQSLITAYDLLIFIRIFPGTEIFSAGTMRTFLANLRERGFIFIERQVLSIQMLVDKWIFYGGLATKFIHMRELDLRSCVLASL